MQVIKTINMSVPLHAWFTLLRNLQTHDMLFIMNDCAGSHFIQYLLLGTSCDATSTVASTIEPTTPCLTYTTGGNAQGAFCQFPFRYKGRAYYECIRVDNKKPWCSTTADYDTEKLWGVCAGT